MTPARVGLSRKTRDAPSGGYNPQMLVAAKRSGWFVATCEVCRKTCELRASDRGAAETELEKSGWSNYAKCHECTRLARLNRNEP